MRKKRSIWRRITLLLHPEPETYQTRRARGGEPGSTPGAPIYEATDGRRSGGSPHIGG